MYNLSNRPYDGTLEQAAEEFLQQHPDVSGIGYEVEQGDQRYVLAVQTDPIGFGAKVGEEVTLWGGVTPWRVVRRVDVGLSRPPIRFGGKYADH